MQRQFFSGNSIEQAVMAAARHYKVDPEKLSYRQRQKKHGFLNVRKRIVIEVDPNALVLTEEEIAQRNAPPEPEVQEVETTPEERASSERGPSEAGDSHDEPAYEDDDFDDEPEAPVRAERSTPRDFRGRNDRRPGGKGKGRGRDQGRGRGRSQGRDRFKPVEVNDFEWMGVDWDEAEFKDEVERDLGAYELCLEQILDVMDLDIEYSIEAGDVISLDFEGEDSSVLLEDDGRVLKAIEHILPRMVRSLVEKSIPCNADCEGFRANHEKELKEMALKAAESVVDTGRKKVLAPMNPADRRIVHLALVDRDDVDTVSEGHGYMKRVKVLPVDEYDD